ncbi:MAG: GGDEF domain-containing protein [Chloroflexota bacterium]|nr:GGDEF domain-containing protein [Chloroflexota bacterium]
MPIEAAYFVVAASIAALLLIGALAAQRGHASDPNVGTGRAAAGNPTGADAGAMERYTGGEMGDEAEIEGGEHPYDRILRVTWWLTIAAVLVGIGLSGAFSENQRLIYALGAAAVATVIVFHELMPAHWLRPARFWIEGGVALALASGLLMLTGYGMSPFFFIYLLVAVAVALARGGRAAFVSVVAAALAYAGVLLLDPVRASFSGADLLRFGVNFGSIWLFAYLASFFAAYERRARSAMLALSLSDPLTGLFNRAQIFATLDQEIRRTRRSERGFCVLMIDLDGLKAVNDSLGHHHGDEVLRQLGTVIRRSIRTVDTAYRYGGDEFVVLLPETEIVGAFVVAEKIRSGAEELGILIGSEGIETSVSIGLVSHPEDGMSVDELMIAADRAMYQAKSLGKNQISGYPRPRRLPPLPAATEQPPEPTPLEPPDAASAPIQAPSLEAVEMATNGSQDGRPTALPMPTAAHEASSEDEPDPSEVRRQIANASRSFDPDHQIRRAMDAFLGPTRPRNERAD